MRTILGVFGAFLGASVVLADIPATQPGVIGQQVVDEAMRKLAERQEERRQHAGSPAGLAETRRQWLAMLETIEAQAAAARQLRNDIEANKLTPGQIAAAAGAIRSAAQSLEPPDSPAGSLAWTWSRDALNDLASAVSAHADATSLATYWNGMLEAAKVAPAALNVRHLDAAVTARSAAAESYARVMSRLDWTPGALEVWAQRWRADQLPK